ncbi:hypothetical protein GE09DRAFT_581191 [Coniochaeta sp. 2T2.1]|nr:hypothetical protein GE09DRAFT_581191 [Coniochaeta sp. 2T2.1]
MEVDDKPSPPDKMPAGFTTLPIEIRKMIYRFAVPNGYVFDVRDQPTFKSDYLANLPEFMMNRVPRHFMDMGRHFSEPVDNWADTQDEDDGSKSDGSEDDDGNDDPMSDSDEDGSDGDIRVDEEEGGTMGSESGAEDDLHHMRGVAIDKYVNASELKPIFLQTIQSLLITCRQVREEVLDVLYGENVFRVPLGLHTAEHALRNGFLRSKAFRIKHIMLVYEQYLDDGPELNLDRPMWNKILPNLVSLRLVLCQPIEAAFTHRDHCRRSIAEKKKAWAEELPCALRYLGKKLEPTADFLVDCDKWKLTSKIVDTSLRRKWQHLRTDTGDILLRRPSSWHRTQKWADNDFDDTRSECSCPPYVGSEFGSDGNPLDDISDIFPMYYDSDQYRGWESSSWEDGNGSDGDHAGDDNNDSDGSSSSSDDDDDSPDPESSDKTPLNTDKSAATAKGKGKAHHSVNDFFGEEYPSLAQVLTEADCNTNMRHLSDKLFNAGPLSKLVTSLGAVFETLNKEVCCLLQSKDDLETENDILHRELYQEEEEKKKLRKENEGQSSMINLLNYEIDLLEKEKDNLRKQVNKDLAAENAALAAEVKKLKEQLAEKTARKNATEDKTKEEKPMEETTEKTAMEVDALSVGTN